MQSNQVTLNEFDLQQWADFSNDRNPIHFDLEAAKQLNLENIVAHGKLALLPIKARVSAALSQQSDWYKFKVAFRDPVSCQRLLNINLVEKSSRTTFNLNDAITDHTYIKGAVSACEPVQVIDIVLSDKISTVNLTNKLQKFIDAFPNCLHDWIVIDSLLFSDLVDKHFSNIINQYSDNKIIDIKNNEKHNIENNFVIQTSQETVFKSTLLESKLCRGELQNSTFSYQVGDIVSYQDNDKYICSIDIAININNENVMVTRYGFILI